MIALMQRVTEASVSVAGSVIGRTGPGLMVLVCAEKGDGEEEARKLAARLLKFRVFADADGRMNLSVRQVGGGLLLVPQFTLAADTRSGNRPSFSPAAPPDEGRRLFDVFAAAARESGLSVETGEFGAHMMVSLVNDGPVTFTLRT